MAVDALEKHSLASLAAEKELQYGIVRKVVNLREAELARRIGRERGVYVTFDCPPASMEKGRAVRALKSYIANTLVEMVGVMGRKSKVLVVGSATTKSPPIPWAAARCVCWTFLPSAKRKDRGKRLASAQ